MIRLESVEDDMQGVLTYRFPNGQCLRVDRHMVQEFGLREIARAMGCDHLLPTERIPVIQDGCRVGTVPGYFEPLAIRSESYFYEPRPGDFVRRGDVWVADRLLGPGDLEAVPGFVWDREQPR